MAPRPRLAGILPSPSALLLSAEIVVFLSFCIWLGGGHVPAAFPLLAFVTAAASEKCGELFIGTSRQETTVLSFLVGFGALLGGMTALTLLVGLSPIVALCFLIAAVAVISACIRAAPTQVTRAAAVDLTVVMVVATIICCRGRVALSSPLFLESHGILTTWVDYYLHSETISSFGSPFAVGGDIEVALARRPFYHYASYLVPAAFQSVTHLPGLVLATSFLMPLGLLVAAMGCYVLAIEVGGRTSGLVAITLLAAAPIVSANLLASGWYDVYWLLFISPGSGYGLGLACVASALLAAYAKNKDRKALVAGGLVAASLAVTRVHFFILAAPVLGFFFLALWKPRIAKILSGALVAVFVAGLFCLAYSSDLRQRWELFSRATEYLDFALQWSPQAQRLVTELGPTSFVGGLSLKVGLTLAAILGVFVFIYPVFLMVHLRQRLLALIDLLPILSLAVFVLLILLAPPANHGDISEYKHRHFSLLYAYVVIFASCYASRLLPSIEGSRAGRRKIVWSLVLLVFIVSAALGWTRDPGKANEALMPWAEGLQYRPIQAGMQETARYMLEHSEPGDIFTTSPSVAAIFSPESPPAIMIGLTGIPAFVARAELKRTGSSCMQRLVDERMAMLNKIKMLSDLNAVYSTLQQARIRWFVAVPGERLSWDPDRNAAVFSKEGFSVYDAGRPKAQGPIKLAC